MGIIRRKLFNHITQGDEDRARAALLRYREESPELFEVAAGLLSRGGEPRSPYPENFVAEEVFRINPALTPRQFLNTKFSGSPSIFKGASVHGATSERSGLLYPLKH